MGETVARAMPGGRLESLHEEAESTSGQLIDIQTVIQRLRMQCKELETENADLRAQLGTWEGRRDNAQLGAEQERDFYMRRCEALERELEALRNAPRTGSTHRVVFHSEQTLDGYTAYGYPTKAEHYRPISQPMSQPLPMQPRPDLSAPAPMPAPSVDPPQVYAENRG